MTILVTGVVRGLSRIYANGLEGLELHIRKKHASDIPYVDGNGIEVRLHVGGAEYHATLRASARLDILWFSPTIFAANGTRSTLAEAFHAADIVRNERLDLVVDGTNFVARKRVVDNEALKAALDEVTERWRVSDDLTTRALADVTEARDELSKENPTTRSALIEARLGQGRFRHDLFKYWDKKCAVTSCDIAEVLIASHIKPWCESSNRERLDPFNGLPLISTLDRLFDAGLISFDDDGEMLIDPTISLDQREALGIGRPLRLRLYSPSRSKYLDWHRKNVFSGKRDEDATVS